MTMAMGQPGFFAAFPIHGSASAAPKPRLVLRQRAPRTLLQLVDFELLNGGTRYACGAVNVLNGNFAYFDSGEVEIIPEHVMASGALPPALPMVQIGTDYYWDGGLVSNTPLQWVLESGHREPTLVLQVDLFSARGQLPRDMYDVMARQKDIQYSVGRTAGH
jgi:NTE family protein